MSNVLSIFKLNKDTNKSLNKLHWFMFCVLIFALSRFIMLYQFDLASDLKLFKHIGNADFFNTMCKWDCKWYITIIQNGYDLVPRTSPKIWKGLANWAFFPLYPYIVKYLAIITNLNMLVVGVLFNQLLVFISLTVFYKLLKLSQSELNSRFGVILLAFSPFNIYFATLYTEALFLTLSLLAFYNMKKNNLLLAAIFGGLLSATRPIGIMFLIPFLGYLVVNSKFTFRSYIKILLLMLISSLGLALFMYYLKIHTGDSLAFQHIQKGWGRHGFESSKIGYQLLNMVRDTHNFIFFSLSFILSIYLIIRRHFSEAIFNILCILPGALTATMMSEARFSGTLFALYLGLVIVCRRSDSIKMTIGMIFLVFYSSYFLYWMAHSNFLV